MAVNQLFPGFAVPEEAVADPGKRTYRPSVFFDFAEGDFRRDGAGNLVSADPSEAYCQWCIKTVLTERFAHLAYGTELGTEMERALTQADAAAVESDVQRTIGAALGVNPKTEYVRSFDFRWNGDSLFCAFSVRGFGMEERRLSVTLPLKTEGKG